MINIVLVLHHYAFHIHSRYWVEGKVKTLRMQYLN